MSNWQEFTISKIIDEQRKSKLQVQNAIDHGSYPFFTSGERVLKHTEYIAEGDNIFLATGGVANVKYYSGKCAYSTDTYVLKCKDFDTKYFYYFLLEKRDFINDNLFSGSGLKHLQKKDFYKICFKAPVNTGEQQKIAKILSTTDTVIEKTQAAIAKYKAIKQGMLHDLFTRGIDIKTGKLRPKQEDAPGSYKKSELGWIPKEWTDTRLGECGTFRKGGNIPKSLLSHSGVGCVIYGQLYTTYQETIDKVFSKVEKQVIENMKPLEFGSILFAGSGETHEEIGKCVVLLNNDDEIYAGGDIVILDLNDKYFKPFFGYYLNFQPIQLQKSKLGQGSSVIHIYATHISSINVALPSRKEQESIFEIIDKLKNKLRTEENYLVKLQQIKSGLMTDLLSGNKMVKV